MLLLGCAKEQIDMVSLTICSRPGFHFKRSSVSGGGEGRGREPGPWGRIKGLSELTNVHC